MSRDKRKLLVVTGATRVLLLAIVSIAALMGTRADAVAGTYVINNCNVPDQGSAPSSPWFWEFAANASSADDCAKGGGFGFYFGGPLVMPRGANAALTLITPPGGAITIRRVRLWMAARLESTGSALYVGTNAGAVDGQLTNTGVFIPPGGETLGSPFVTPLMPLGTNVFRVLLYCSESSPSDCYPTSRSVLEVLGAETTLLESVPPSVSATGGTLLSNDAQSGTRTLQYTAGDDESGIEGVDVMVYDAVALRRDLAADCPRTGLAACPKRRVEDLSIDTGDLTNGPHRLRLRARDAAGNVAESDPRTIQVRNARVPDAPSAEQGRLTAAFAGTSKRALVVDYSRRVTVRGRLTRSNGAGVAGAELVLVESVAGEKSKTPRLVAQTGEDGRFSFRLSPSGRSRTVRVYRALASGQPIVAAPILKLRVRASASLAVSLDGIRVSYRGRLVSGRIPSRGVVVILQGRREGGVWQPFAYRRVRGSGTFRGSYRLRVRRPGVSLQFRAMVPRAAGYLYEAGASAIVTRRVR